MSAVVAPVIPQVLYRFYSADGKLLYVGITLNPHARWEHHAKNKAWWRDVARIEIEHYEDRASVQTAELAAIQGEHPRYNVRVGMIKRTYYVPRDLYEAALEKTEKRGEDLADVIRRALREYVEAGK